MHKQIERFRKRKFRIRRDVKRCTFSCVRLPEIKHAANVRRRIYLIYIDLSIVFTYN